LSFLRLHFLPLAVASVLVALFAVIWIGERRQERIRTESGIIEAACADCLALSDGLTRQIYAFLDSDGSAAACEPYFVESCSGRRRERILASIEGLRGYGRSARHLRRALELSLELMNMEYHAMRLTLADAAIPFAPPEVRGLSLTDEERLVTFDERRRRAREEIHGAVYAEYKAGIHHQISNALHAARREGLE